MSRISLKCFAMIALGLSLECFCMGIEESEMTDGIPTGAMVEFGGSKEEYLKRTDMMIEITASPFYVGEKEKKHLKQSVLDIWKFFFCCSIDSKQKISKDFWDYEEKTFLQLAEETGNEALVSFFKNGEIPEGLEINDSIMTFVQHDSGRTRRVMPDFWRIYCRDINPLLMVGEKNFFVVACENLNAKLADCMVENIIERRVPFEEFSPSIPSLLSLFYNMLVTEEFIFSIFLKIETKYLENILSLRDFSEKFNALSELMRGGRGEPFVEALRCALERYPNYRKGKNPALAKIFDQQAQKALLVPIPSPTTRLDAISGRDSPLPVRGTTSQKRREERQLQASRYTVDPTKTKSQRNRDRRRRARERWQEEQQEKKRMQSEKKE